MKQREFSSAVKRRTSFFNSFLDKGMGYVGNYNTVTSMVFDTKKSALNLYNNSENRTENITQNIYNTTNSTIDVYPSDKISPPWYVSEPTKEFTHKKIFFDKRVSDNSRYLFNSAIVKKFIKFSPTNRTDIQHQNIFTPVVDSYFDLKSMDNQSLAMHNEMSTTMVHKKKKESIHFQEIKELEERVLHRVEERIEFSKKENTTTTVTREERLVLQREEKKSADKIYTLVMKRWDRELSRKGHLYD